MEKLALIDDERGPTLTATLKYSPFPDKGFTQADKQKVVLLAGNELRDSHNVVYSWRFPLSMTEESMGNSDKGLDAAASRSQKSTSDKSYQPDPSPLPAQHLGKRKRLSEDDEECTRREDVQVNRKCQSLELRLNVLEEDVKSHSRAIENFPLSVHGPNKAEPMPLNYLRARITEFLDKLPQTSCSTSTADTSQGKHWYSQYVSKFAADCTLLEFDNLATLIRKKLGDEATFAPSFEEFQRYPRSDLCVSFATFASFSKVFANLASEQIEGILTKPKFTRGTNMLVGIRVLGVALSNKEDENEAFMLTIGHGVTGLNGCEIRVLMRANQRYNHVEQKFEKPLKSTKVASSIIKDTAHRLGVEGLSTFCIRWKLLQPKELRDSSTSLPLPTVRGDVLGVLEASIPYYVVRRMEFCEEFLSVKGTM